MVNLTVKEKNDLCEVYDCFITNNEFESILYNIYKISNLLIKKLGNLRKYI